MLNGTQEQVHVAFIAWQELVSVSRESLQKIVIKMKNGQEMEVYDNPKAYDIIMA